MAACKTSAKFASEIATLGDLGRTELAERWTKLFGKTPSNSLSPDLLARGIAFELQVRELGYLTVRERKQLEALANGGTKPPSKSLQNGTRLYRTWQGVTHEVLVLESGYSWKGVIYASLSKVARAITGTHWSGPRFFGVLS